MKFIVPFALLAAAVVSAQDESCEANYIVETCFASENKKLTDCSTTDYDCLCRAAEALATCFNNCPNDQRAETYRGLVTTHCQNASIHGTAAHATQTTGSEDASNTESADAEETGSDDSSSDSADSTESSEESGASATESGAGASESPDSGVGHLARNTAGVLLAVAGAVAAML